MSYTLTESIISPLETSCSTAYTSAYTNATTSICYDDWSYNLKFKTYAKILNNYVKINEYPCYQGLSYKIVNRETSATNWDTISWKYKEDWYPFVPVAPSPREQLRKAMAQRLAPAIHVLRKALTPAEERETRARETLRRVVGDEKYQKYLRCGFVTVRNPRNGLTYQCFPGHGGVKVWKDGQMVESWCVLLQGEFPPTDQLITRYLMVLNNPDQLRAIANVSRGTNRMRQPQQATPQEDLVKLFKKLKAA